MIEPEKGVDSNSFRRRRLLDFLRLCQQARIGHNKVKVLDVGGTAAYWHAMQDVWVGSELEITVLNLGLPSYNDGLVELAPGDARDLSNFSDAQFDIVHI